MNDTCNYCGEKFEEGQNILIHEYDCGELYFCDSYCAGAHFVEDECQGTSFSKEEE
jgi:ribosomal protein L24E